MHACLEVEKQKIHILISCKNKKFNALIELMSVGEKVKLPLVIFLDIETNIWLDNKTNWLLYIQKPQYFCSSIYSLFFNKNLLKIYFLTVKKIHDYF